MICEDCYSEHLAYFACCIANKANKLVKKWEIGRDCIELQREIQLLTVFLEQLRCIDISTSGNVTTCITEDQICDMVEYFKDKCKDCCT